MQCPHCKSRNITVTNFHAFDGVRSLASCLDCYQSFKPSKSKSAPCDVKVITEAISEPAGIPVTVYERISTGEVLVTPTSLFNRGRTHA